MLGIFFGSMSAMYVIQLFFFFSLLYDEMAFNWWPIKLERHSGKYKNMDEIVKIDANCVLEVNEIEQETHTQKLL